jgi:hypothetical protein
MKIDLVTRTGICIALASSLFFAGCGGGGGATTTSTGGCGTAAASPCPTSDFLYATSPSIVLGFTADATTGMLSAPTSVPGPGSTLGIPSFGLVNAQGFVYVADTQNSQVDGFSVNKTTGVLTTLPSSPFPLPLGFPALEGVMAANAQGKLLYLVSSGTIDGFSIDS